MSLECKVVVVGAGVAGMVFALALKEQTGLVAEIYEGAPSFHEGAGGAIGLYPNGLKVVRDLCGTSLLRKIQLVSRPYRVRRWMRHTGQEIANASEGELMLPGEPDLEPIGIRRSRLLKVLTDECALKGIKIHFDKRLTNVKIVDGSHQKAIATFHDGSSVEADLLLGADGIKSATRLALFGNEEPVYSGVTVTMGISPNRRNDGICFPSGPDRVHACIYPTQDDECTFQIYQHEPVESPESWQTLSGSAADPAKKKLAETLKKQGWSQDVINHVKDAENLIRLGVRFRKPIQTWYKGPVVLIGDAAHAIVPYMGQGAMLAIEDAGTLVLCLMRAIALGSSSNKYPDFESAFAQYNKVRLPRATWILENSLALGKLRAMESSGWLDQKSKEISLWATVMKHGTLPTLKQATSFDYAKL